MAIPRTRPPQPLAPHGIPGHLVEFVEALRKQGISVGPSETVDAGRVLSDFAVTVPELGTITAERAPFVLLTSNATRELSEALKRRCLFLHIDFPDPDLERRILLSRVPELPEHLAQELVKIIGVLRGMQLKKLPSVAETIDWGRTVLALGMDTIDDEVIAATLGVVLKHQSDQVKAAGELRLN